MNNGTAIDGGTGDPAAQNVPLSAIDSESGKKEVLY